VHSLFVLKKETTLSYRLPIFLLLVYLWIASPASANTIAEVAAMPLGTDATVDPAVILSTTDLTADSSIKSFQIRDNTRAITIYGTNAEIDAALTGFGVGDTIEISGQTAKRDGGLVLVTSIGGFAVTGRTTTAPILTNAILVSPPDIAASFESNLVCLQNVSFADTGMFAAGADYTLTGGAATVRITSADLGFTGMTIPTGLLNITGIVIPADPTSPDAGYCLALRSPADIAPVPEPLTMVAVGMGIAGLGSYIRRRTAAK
jgi:hypothetical protein